MRTIVVGAGPAGLTAAYQLTKEAPFVDVFEASDCVGGMARSITLWGQTVDLGPHRFFSQDERVNRLWMEVVGDDYAIIERQTRILYQAKLYQYPLEVRDALTKFGVLEAGRCIVSYAKEFVLPTPQDGSFENWVSNRFGRRLFEIFFKTYSEKLWGISCKTLDSDFAAQRIRNFSMGGAVKSIFIQGQNRAARTVIDKFAYPLEGSGIVYERMADLVKKRGGKVHMRSPVRRLIIKNNRVTGIECLSGQKEFCDQVITTMPLTTLVRQMDGAPVEVVHACEQIAFRNTILVYLEILNENPFTDNWVYVHDPDLAFGRVTNFRNWVPTICGKSPHTILAMEYWCNASDEFWTRDNSLLIEQAKTEIVRAGLVGSGNKIGKGFVLKIPNSYPVYRRGYKEHVSVIRNYLQHISGLQVIGRGGAFKYNNQDHSILMGHLAAENILKEQSHDLWGVNTDYDTYQEKQG